MASQGALNTLNKEVANYGLLFVKLHNYHWYISGPHFFTYHEKLEELYNLVAELYDDVAERLLMNDGEPYATMKEYLEHSTLQEGDRHAETDQMIKDIIGDFKQIRQEMQDAMENFEDGDEAIEDTFVSHIERLEKEIWMMSAALGKKTKL
ncbi:MAG: DNA starvation/stationary phase protection protein [Exiguobacterium sp.]|mgnify:FL=1|uniref:DNA starvation/stationary phase protection protein n=1 Tax=Exiguobacterium alkaliphilum TaxID=1428684 RepID=A0ABT2L1Y3_9BACL|nr:MULTISPECIES: DNA starvation/stationary phase protection protein [Exiguobacterium]MDX5322969.1 DNA starvation/stationary phase protection protein [Exiguobacterium sp.]MCT4796791.1 DNA starvation/stationary phase protection protein [Exiguobacterium alkaliphilum]MDX5424729.1 DNA starvation/stationary phase protection protein [Exiguobacterium sp.]MDX6772204.1 DNA starvation/stationary phase protection protein [Exiguobacterium sp.]QUE87606.1 DNA starvation/stationary phase protection protein [E